MQRNMDLVRTILMRIEESPSGWAEPREIAGFTHEQVGYHAHIMIEDGLIEGTDVTTLQSKGPEALPRALTWKGHEFLDLARDQRRVDPGQGHHRPGRLWTSVRVDQSAQ